MHLLGKFLELCCKKITKIPLVTSTAIDSRSASAKGTRHCGLSLVTLLISLKMLFLQNIVRSIGLHVRKRANLTSV